MKKFMFGSLCLLLSACSSVPETYSVLDKTNEQLAAEEIAIYRTEASQQIALKDAVITHNEALEQLFNEEVIVRPGALEKLSSENVTVRTEALEQLEEDVALDRYEDLRAMYLKELSTAKSYFSIASTKHIRSARMLPSGILTVRKSVTYDILPKGMQPNEGHAAYGYVIAKSSEPDELEKLNSLCLSMTQEYNLDGRSSRQERFRIPTYWPTIIDVRDSTFCNIAINNYDFAWGRDAIAKLDVVNRGPYLVAWEVPFDKVDSSSNRILIDLSRLNNDQMTDVVLWWEQKVAKNPLRWNSGIDTEFYRLEINAFIDTYGEGILAAFKLFSDGKSIAIAATN